MSGGLRNHKAVYTTATVVCGWAEAVTQVRSLFGVIYHCVTNGRTDRQSANMTGMDEEVEGDHVDN